MLKITSMMAASLDGAIAEDASQSQRERNRSHLSCQEDQELLRRELDQSEALIMGAQTLRASPDFVYVDQATSQRSTPPYMVVLTRSGIDSSHPFWSWTHLPRLVVSPRPLAGVSEPVTQLSYGDSEPARLVVQTLCERGVSSALLLGGAEANSLFWRCGLVDELKLTLTPHILRSTRAVPLVKDLDKRHDFGLVSSRVNRQGFVFLHMKKRQKPLASVK